MLNTINLDFINKTTIPPNVLLEGYKVQMAVKNSQDCSDCWDCYDADCHCSDCNCNWDCECGSFCELPDCSDCFDCDCFSPDVDC